MLGGLDRISVRRTVAATEEINNSANHVCQLFSVTWLPVEIVLQLGCSLQHVPQMEQTKSVYMSCADN